MFLSILENVFLTFKTLILNFPASHHYVFKTVKGFSIIRMYFNISSLVFLPFPKKILWGLVFFEFIFYLSHFYYFLSVPIWRFLVTLLHLKDIYFQHLYSCLGLSMATVSDSQKPRFVL